MSNTLPEIQPLVLYSQGLRITMEDPIFQDARPTDRIIPVMGPPGVGKSTFVNSLCDNTMAEVGHGLATCTKVLQPIVLEPTDGPFRGHRLVIVDTPPFNSINISDSEILKRIAQWLALSYKCDMKLAGIIYLFETSQPPLSRDNRRDREILRKLCGDQALSMVIVGTTKWEFLDVQFVEKHEQELRDGFWDGIPNPVRQLRTTRDTPWEIVNQLAEEGVGCTVLQIQKELIDYGKYINDTEAGRYIYQDRPGKPRNFSLARRILIFFRTKRRKDEERQPEHKT